MARITPSYKRLVAEFIQEIRDEVIPYYLGDECWELAEEEYDQALRDFESSLLSGKEFDDPRTPLSDELIEVFRKARESGKVDPEMEEVVLHEYAKFFEEDEFAERYGLYVKNPVPFDGNGPYFDIKMRHFPMEPSEFVGDVLGYLGNTYKDLLEVFDNGLEDDLAYWLEENADYVYAAAEDQIFNYMLKVEFELSLEWLIAAVAKRSGLPRKKVEELLLDVEVFGKSGGHLRFRAIHYWNTPELPIGCAKFLKILEEEVEREVKKVEYTLSAEFWRQAFELAAADGLVEQFLEELEEE